LERAGIIIIIVFREIKIKFILQKLCQLILNSISRWDYKTSESKRYWFNPSLLFIDIAALLGLATDLKTVPQNMIRERIMRTGDGTHKFNKVAKSDVEAKLENNNNKVERDTEHFWGWGKLLLSFNLKLFIMRFYIHF
jgi:hypothetical protein